MKIQVLLTASLSLALATLAIPPSMRADVVTDWNQIMLRAQHVADVSPPAGGRGGALVQVAVFDALNGVERRFQSIHVPPNAPPGASGPAAVVQAAYTMLVLLYPGQKPDFDTNRAASLAALMPSSDSERASIASGTQWGESVANSIWAWRSTDGFTSPPPAFVGGTNVGEWRPTPPNFLPGGARQFATMPPWVMTSPSQFRPTGPPALTSDRYTADFNEVKMVGGASNAVRTADQTLAAEFWNSANGSYFWNSLAQRLLAQRQATLSDSARVLALLNLAMADGRIACWDAKYYYVFWRPITAITLAGTDGNSATVEDPNWTPSLGDTPNHPDYPSGHSTETAAATTVLARFFGEQTSFYVDSDWMPRVTRSFSSFAEASREVNSARVWGGIHFRTACEDGQATGQKVANYIVQRAAQPIDEVLVWNGILREALYTPPIVPGANQFRLAAIVQSSVFDAVNGIERRFTPIHVRPAGPTGASRRAAAAQAAYTALLGIFPAQSNTFSLAISNSLARIEVDPTETTSAIAAGRAWGEQVANDILAWRRTDGFDPTSTYVGSTNVGKWQPTPPAFANGLTPSQATTLPWVIPSPSAFRPPGPPELTSARYATDFNEVKAYADTNSTVRTADQTMAARFWAGTAVTFWNRAAADTSVQRNLSLSENARLFALLNTAMSDGAISCWDAKYHFEFWRPVTSIRLADTDGNPDTAPQADWTPLIATPPYPEYTSGHATVSGAGQQVLTLYFGTNVPVSGWSEAFGETAVRTWPSFSAAGDEANLARIWGGMHYRFAVKDGRAAGNAVATYVFAHAAQTTDVVTEWNAHLERALKTAAVSAALQARLCAIVSASVYDAVNGLALTYQPYFVHERGPAGARQDAAAVQAAYTSLVSLFPTQAVTFDAALVTSLAQLPDAQTQSNAIATGRAWGQSVAQRILAWRAQDGLTNPAPNYFGGTNIGQWRSIATGANADGTLPAIVPQMPTLVPFTMTSPTQFRPGPPYELPLAQALASSNYARDFNEVKAIGRVDSTTRTADQTALARLWQASSTAELNNCLRQVLPATNSLADNARLFALANLVAADALIVGFDSKYTYNFWRPHHAIRFADLDGNPETEADPAWSGLILAPRHQEFISNHAVHSGGFAYMVRRLLGDAHTFTLGSVDFPSFTWTFHSWSEVMSQVKEARIWGGIHYRNSCNVGEQAGQSLADYVLTNYLRPAVPLVISRQPIDQNVIAGSTATFTVVASGTAPLRYQWRSYVNQTTYTNIPSATNATLVLENVQPNNVRFAVEVTDGFGNAGTSDFARLTVGVPPTLTSQPGDVSAVLGEAFTLGVQATGTVPLSYQWQWYGTNLPMQTRSNLTFASVQLNNAGPYVAIVSNPYGTATSRVVNLTVVQPTSFTRITSGPVVTDPGDFTRFVWGDFNNDGFLDLFVHRFGGSKTNVLYRNNGDRTFTKIANGVPLQDADNHTGVAAADYDNDGHLDLISVAGIGSTDGQLSSLYHNRGDGTFSFSRESGGSVGTLRGYYNGCAWADYDNDGFVDLFICNIGFNGTGGTNILWRNSGDGTFTRVAPGSIATDVGDGVPLWSDYDNDGLIDLTVPNFANNVASATFLYHNDGNGAFTRVLANPIATDRWNPGASCGAWADYDNDGLLDLFITDFSGARNRLYHNDGNGSFSAILSAPMVVSTAGARPNNGCAWGDYDNDGYLDLFIAGAGDRNRLFRNNGDGTFTEIKTGPHVNDSGGSFLACGWADYDNDGFLDVFVTNGNGSNHLYHNEGNSNSWLEVKCVGTVANRSAVGAKVRLVTTIGGKAVSQLREINTGGGWNCVPLITHLGLGNATNVETLRLEWPSGTVQEFHNVASRQILTITEPPRLTATRASGRPQFTLKGGRNMSYTIEASTNLVNWSSIASVTLTNFSGTAPILDPSGSSTPHRFYRALSR